MSNPTVEADVAVIAEQATASNRDRSYVDWPAILGGVVTAWALSFVLGTFGSGIGLSMTATPWTEGMSPVWFFAAAAMWFVWVQVSSVMAGGYLAGRLRHRIGDATKHEVEMRDGAHGLLVWGVSALVGAALALGTVSGAVGTVTSLTGAVAAEGGPSSQPVDYVLDRLFRPAAAAEAGTSRTSQAGVENARQEVKRIIVVRGLDGELSADDEQHIARLLETRAGLSRAEAMSRVNTYLTQTLAAMREASEKARKTGIVVAFLTAATLLISALGGWWAAGVGGRHRDEYVDLTGWFRFR